MKRKIGILLAALLWMASLAAAQVAVEKSNEKIRINGELYYVHTVKKGETVYSISKAYNVTQENLANKNPKLAEGLKTGDRLVIPLEDETEPSLSKNQTTATSATNTSANGGARRHLVLAKETLYSISRQYHVDINELRRVNNLPSNDIKIGMELVIPGAGSAQTTTPVTTAEQPVTIPVKETPPPTQTTAQQQPNSSSKARYHKIKENETLASIANVYGVSEKALEELNKDVFRRGRFTIGALLEIPPVSAATVPPTEDPLQPIAVPEKPHYVDCLVEGARSRERTYKIALLLPLGAATAAISEELITDETLSTRSGEQARVTDNYVEFYEGALLALEDIKKQGMNIDLSVFDILNRREDVMELINRNTLQGFDLLIGPIHAQDFAPVAEYAKQHQIKIVSPIDAKTEKLTDVNPYVFQVNPPLSFQYRKLFNDINPEKDRNVVMVYERGFVDTTLVETIFNALDYYAGNIRKAECSVTYGKTSGDSIRHFLHTNQENRVVIASNNEVFVTGILTQLHQLAILRKYQITVYGTSRWRNFENIDLNYFHELNLKMEVPFYIDYNAPQVKDFVARYRTTFNGEPSQFAFQGYDVLMYFLQAFLKYGVHFEQCIASFTPELLQTKYHFYRNDSQYGFWNTESVRITYTPSFTIEKD